MEFWKGCSMPACQTAVRFRAAPKESGSERSAQRAAPRERPPGSSHDPSWFRHRAATINDHAPLHATSRSKPIGNWLIGLGCLLAIVVAVAVGNGATIAVGKNPLRPDRVLTNAITLQGDADHYVEGLARLGIVRLPCFPGLVAQLDLTRVSICALTLAGSLPGTRMAGARCRLPRICLCSRRCQGRGSHSVRVSLRTG